MILLVVSGSDTDEISGNMGFPSGLDSKESTSNAGDVGSIPGSGRPPLEEGHVNLFSILAWKIP